MASPTAIRQGSQGLGGGNGDHRHHPTRPPVMCFPGDGRPRHRGEDELGGRKSRAGGRDGTVGDRRHVPPPEGASDALPDHHTVSTAACRSSHAAAAKPRQCLPQSPHKLLAVGADPE